MSRALHATLAVATTVVLSLASTGACQREDNAKVVAAPGPPPGSNAPLQSAASGSAALAASASAAAALSAELEALEMKSLGVLGGTGPAVTSGTDSGLDALGAKGVDGPEAGSSGEIKLPTGEINVAAASGAAAIPGVDSVIAKHRWRFKACYHKVLASDPGAHGSATVSATVSADGEVTDAKATGDAGTALLTCVGSTFKSIRFAEPSGKAVVKFTVKLTFSIKS